MAMWVRLPLDTFNRFSFTLTQFQSNNMSNSNNNNNPPRVLPNGDANIQGNPRVLAAFLDLLGSNLTAVLNRARSANMEPGDPSPDLTADAMLQIHTHDVQLLCELQQLLGILRNCVGRGETWHRENLCMEVMQVSEERVQQDEKRNAALLELLEQAGMPIPDDIRAALTPRPSPAASADAILDSLRADGVIG